MSATPIPAKKMKRVAQKKFSRVDACPEVAAPPTPPFVPPWFGKAPGSCPDLPLKPPGRR